MRRTPLFVGLIVLCAGVAVAAHVTMAPVESKLGASERYTVRVPTEGQVTTVGVDLEVPVSVTVSSVLASPGWKTDLRREGNRIVAIRWTVEIPAGHFGELVFNARNPKEGADITWKVVQKFADGTSREWTPKTTLIVAP